MPNIPANPSAQFDSATARVLATVQQRHAGIAKAAHASVMNADPKPSSFQRFVDGVKGAPEEAVKLDGVIVYDYPRIDLVAGFALEILQALSPVKSGDYKGSHQIYINDDPAGYNAGVLKNWKYGDKVFIANEMPYARKIELGAMKMKVPGTDHVYHQAAIIVRNRYGSLVTIRFTYVGLVDGSVVRGRAGNVSGIRYPALVFEG